MDPWAIVDPVLAHDARLRDVCQRLMTIVRSNWTDLPEIDVGDARIMQFLMRHRVGTLIPLEAVPEQHQEMFAERLRAIYVSQMRIEATAREVGEVLADAGIECRLLKGLASAYLDYPRPEYRHTGDVDVAVRPSDLAATRQALAAAGMRPRSAIRPEPIMKGVTLDQDRRVEVDVHDRLFVRSRLSDVLFESEGDVTPIGIPALDPTQRVVNAAGAFILTPVGFRRLSGLIDVTQLLDAGPIGFDDMLELCDSMRVAGLVGETLRLEATVSGRDAPSLPNWPRVSLLDRATRLGPRRRLALEHVVRLRHVPIEQLPGYLPKWFVPSPEERGKFTRSIAARTGSIAGRRGGRRSEATRRD